MHLPVANAFCQAKQTPLQATSKPKLRPCRPNFLLGVSAVMNIGKATQDSVLTIS